MVGGDFKDSIIHLGNEKQISKSGGADGMLIKYNIEGECEWGINIGGYSNDYITSIAETEDGGYLVGGYFDSSSINLGNGKQINNQGNYDGMLIKYNIEGECEWGINIAGISNDRIVSVAEAPDGGYIVGGYFSSGSINLGNGKQISNQGDNDGMIIKYSKEGECEWGTSIGGSSDDRINSVTETEDGGCLIGGHFNSSRIDLGNGKQLSNHSSYSDAMLIKYNVDGKCEWGLSIGDNSIERINSVAKTEDGGYLVGGYFGSNSINLGNGKQIVNYGSSNYYSSDSDGMIIKYNREGECEWGMSIGGSSSDYIQSVTEAEDGGYVLGGYFRNSNIDLGNGIEIINHNNED